MRRSQQRQLGIALLTAMVLVAIAAVLATAIGFASAMAARRASTLFGADQSLLAGEGAEAMAAYVLKVSTSATGSVSMDQYWAQPYGPFALGEGVTLEYAQIEDQQGKFNINNLASTGSTDQAELLLFQQLLERLGLETKWAGLIADWIDVDNTPNSPDGAEDSVYLTQSPPYRAANMPVTSISELLALPGFGRDRYNKLAPYIAALPPGTTINVCTASGVLLDALSGKTEYSTDASVLTNGRKNNGCFPPINVYTASLSTQGQGQLSGKIDVKSAYFRLRSVITIGTARFTLYSLLYRDPSGQIRPIIRTFGTE
ncbi:MAG TPA: type II secretion system minor pseudopilin GspK [Steroidobacteraceae bacterium]|jgi:general secretion pathway protein K